MSADNSLDLTDIPGLPAIEHYWWPERAVTLHVGGCTESDVLFAVLDPYTRTDDVITVVSEGQPVRTVQRPPTFITQELTPLIRLTPSYIPTDVDQYWLVADTRHAEEAADR